MTEEASPFIKGTDATVQLEDCYPPFPPQSKQKTRNEKGKMKETSTWVAKGFSSSGIR